MQRMSFVVLFVCLLLGKAAPRQLTQDKTIVTASSDSNTQGGTATTITFATARVRTEVTNPLAEAVGESINVVKGGGDVDAQVDITATAIAKAIIEIALDAEVEATVEGTGSACGKATVSIQRTLTVVAEAVAKAFAQAENDFIIAQGDAVAKAIKEATISLDASVSAEACSQGGVARAAQTLKGSKGLEATAQAIARAYAVISKGEGDSASESISNSTVKETGTLTGETSSNVSGLGDAKAGAVANFSICSQDEQGCCDPNRRFMGFCFCGNGCTVVSFPSGGNRELKLRIGDKEEKTCFCN